MKALVWGGDGFLLLYKRLDNGRFQWPRNETEAKLLTPQQTRRLLEGLKIEQPKAIRDGKPGILYQTSSETSEAPSYLSLLRRAKCLTLA